MNKAVFSKRRYSCCVAFLALYKFPDVLSRILLNKTSDVSMVGLPVLPSDVFFMVLKVFQSSVLFVRLAFFQARCLHRDNFFTVH